MRRIGLGALLNATARRHPERVAFTDPSDKPGWSGRPAITWTYAAAAEIVARLAAGLRGWPLPPESRVGLCMAGSAESLLSLLAIEAAGHVPCLLPVTWDEERLVSAVQSAGICAILSQSRLGAAAPAERLCQVAARHFGLRYLAAFGPDVPDGVINLDAVVLNERGDAIPGPAPCGGLVSFARGDPARPVHRAGEALVAAVAGYLVSARVGPGERILSLMPPGDLPALVTGLGAMLVSGASLETLPVFTSRAFAAALARPVPTHLVAPAFLEVNLAGHALPETLRSISLVHRAPARLSGRTQRRGSPRALRLDTIIDVVAFDETAILAGARGTGSDVALALAKPERLGLPAGLMAMRREADGRLAFRGQACAAAALRRGIPAPAPADAWHPSRFEATLFAGIATAVTALADGDPGCEPEF